MNKRPRILIVDDEPLNLDYLEQELEELNYDTISAVNGQAALEKIISESPDLVLLDIMMPIMDGYAVLEKVKANPAIREIPIIIISAHNDLPSIVKGIQLGAEDYLPKPFEPTLLQARLQSSLEKKQLRDLQGAYLKSLERELIIGREIQREFLPAALPQVEGWEIASYFKAAREVAGDFYDAFMLPDGNLAFVVADVCGKGVGAALFMTLFRSLIRAASTSDQFSREHDIRTFSAAQRLGHAISLTNNYVAETHEEADMFATLFYGILDPTNGQLAYINAGNEPPLVLGKNGTITQLHPTGPVVGAIPRANFSVKEFSLGKEDVFLAFTDGVPDSKNMNDEFFGKDRLLSILEKNKAGATDLLENIGAQLQEFRGTSEQFDDITLLALKRTT